MTPQEIIEGNTIIALSPFASDVVQSWIPTAKKYNRIDTLVEKLDYHKNWNLLMPVVEKISQYRLAYPEQANAVCNCKVVVQIDRLFELVVEFITFYNTNNK